MTLTEHYRDAEAALERAEKVAALGDPIEATAWATIALAHAQLASIAVPAGGRL